GDVESLTGDRARFVGREELNERRDLVRLDYAPERNVRGGGVFVDAERVPAISRHVRAHPAGTDDVDGHAPARGMPGERARESEHGVLRGAVRRLVGDAPV